MSAFESAGHSLALRLLGDVTDGGALFPDDGTHVLGGHQQAQGDVRVLVLGGDPRPWGAAPGATPGAVSTAAVVRASLSINFRVLVRDVGDAKGVVLKLVSIQLLDGSGGGGGGLSNSVNNI